ncbi:MAG: thioredoxin [Chlorobi bacterium]|nr:thioredoxin [Chlorobiota bacterium]
MAKEITDANFEEEIIKSGKPALIDFWAVWCGPCRMIEPVVEELAEKYKGKAVVGKMNVDENYNVPVQYGIRAIPTILFFKNGEVVDRVVGVVPGAVLEEKLRKLIEEN